MSSPEDKVRLWAERHREIIGVGLGGSRAKGTHHPESDYDFSIMLEMEPSAAIVERLTNDLSLEHPDGAFVFSQATRRNYMVGRKYHPTNQPEICLAFSSISEFEMALHEQKNYPLIAEGLEFHKTMKIIYDSQHRLKNLQELELPGWVRKHAMRDNLLTSLVSFEKYAKSLNEKKEFSALFMKLDTIWYLIKAVGFLVDVPIGGKYEYDRIKENILDAIHVKQLEPLLPERFFEQLDYCIGHDDAAILSKVLQETRVLIDRITA